MTARFTHSTGNVFADLGIPREEALVYRLRSDLIVELRRIIRDKNLKQEQAAELFGVTQPRISDLVRGQLAKFSVDTLVEMLGKAGIEVNVSFGVAEIAAPCVQEFELELDMSKFVQQPSWQPAQKQLWPDMPVRAQGDYATAA